ncbi:hypothetical protein Aple_104150 [Acrocarpospora pleiomorpha]|uniref:Uncharacterized protein n=1 Tax=Acrocarpospora pleiomorpha TaxID=90975 RepID=A0A5M3Y2I7_9ACTN|nr:hypothetical protein Aple_104150 [Acrocarpospora pleiomorpha]
MLVVTWGAGTTPIALTALIVLAAPIVLIILAVLITLTRVWPGRRYGSGCARAR